MQENTNSDTLFPCATVISNDGILVILQELHQSPSYSLIHVTIHFDLFRQPGLLLCESILACFDQQDFSACEIGLLCLWTNIVWLTDSGWGNINTRHTKLSSRASIHCINDQTKIYQFPHLQLYSHCYPFWHVITSRSFSVSMVREQTFCTGSVPQWVWQTTNLSRLDTVLSF